MKQSGVDTLDIPSFLRKQRIEKPTAAAGRL